MSHRLKSLYAACATALAVSALAAPAAAQQESSRAEPASLSHPGYAPVPPVPFGPLLYPRVPSGYGYGYEPGYWVPRPYGPTAFPPPGYAAPGPSAQGSADSATQGTAEPVMPAVAPSARTMPSGSQVTAAPQIPTEQPPGSGTAAPVTEATATVPPAIAPAATAEGGAGAQTPASAEEQVTEPTQDVQAAGEVTTPSPAANTGTKMPAAPPSPPQTEAPAASAPSQPVEGASESGSAAAAEQTGSAQPPAAAPSASSTTRPEAGATQPAAVAAPQETMETRPGTSAGTPPSASPVELQAPAGEPARAARGAALAGSAAGEDMTAAAHSLDSNQSGVAAAGVSERRLRQLRILQELQDEGILTPAETRDIRARLLTRP